MKKVVVLIVALVFIMLIVACGEQGSNEKAGVPEQQLFADVQGATPYSIENVVYTHDVDEAMHIDRVFIEYDICNDYVTKHYYFKSEYQYDKSTDIWTWISGYEYDDGSSLNSNIENAEFRGTDDRIGLSGLSYHITVTSVDYDRNEVTISYSIIKGDDEYKGYATLGIGDKYTVERYIFGIRFDSQKGLLAEFDERYD